MPSLAPFHNEPLTDFSKPRNAKAFREALSRVESLLGRRYPGVIAGRRVDADDVIVSTNPAKPDEVIGIFPSLSVEQADEAVDAANAAFPAWSAAPWEKRADVLFRVARALRKDKHFFSAWMVKEAGKSWAEADGDTAEAIDFCDFYGREALRYGKGIRVVQTTDRNEAFYVPLGAGAIIAPWNFPLAILCGMTTAALVAGNTVVMKPAGETPTIAWYLFEQLEKAGLPPGVANFLPGKGSTVGGRIVEHPRIRFVCFTGSKEVGLRITEQAGKTLPGQLWIKRVVAEMGGKDAIVVDETADLDAAAEGVVASAFGYQGQKCSACSRAIVVDSVYEPFLEKIVERTKRLSLGDPSDQATDFGPVISKSAFDKTLEYIGVAKREGKVVTGGGAADRPGYFIQPTIVRDVPPKSRIEQEEIFAPVLAVIRAKDWNDAIDIANDTEFGLTGAVFSRDAERLEDAKRRFYVGNLYLNRKCTGALVGAHPFGGFNMSGTCSKAGGPDYLSLFLQQKSVATRPIQLTKKRKPPAKTKAKSKKAAPRKTVATRR